MGRNEQVKCSPEEKWEILQEELKRGNIAETCRKHGVVPTLWYCWRGEAEQGVAAMPPIAGDSELADGSI